MRSYFRQKLTDQLTAELSRDADAGLAPEDVNGGGPEMRVPMGMGAQRRLINKMMNFVALRG